MKINPFFILGCVRSGTTLLRDLLKQHPNLACPEETHFFRWAEPYGSDAYLSSYTQKALFKSHRDIDKVGDFDFFFTLISSKDRRMLMDHYARIFLERNDMAGRRWFDKSPQNVYGILLISGMYPEAKFIHIHRHPFNVVASLKAGKVLDPQDLNSAVNFWLESLTIIREYKQGFSDRILEVGYEQLTSNTDETLQQVLDFIGEPAYTHDPKAVPIYQEKNMYKELLTEKEINNIKERCGKLMNEYGYEYL